MTPLDRLWRHACHLLLLALVAAAGCSSRDAQKQQSDPRPTVLTSFTVLADLARNVAGDRLQVRSIVKPGAEIHGYQPTPSDIERASSADLIVENGLGLELWFRRFTAAAGDVATLASGSAGASGSGGTALLVVGLLATIAVTTLVTRIARRALAEATGE